MVLIVLAFWTLPYPNCSAIILAHHFINFLSAPIGSGMLWIKKEKISIVWPLVCNDKPQSDDIRKFETLGTRSFPIEQGIGEALHFHNHIGSKRKEERIRFLKNYWANQVKDIKGVKLHTSLKDKYSCAICGISIEGKTPAETEQFLFEKYKNSHCKYSLGKYKLRENYTSRVYQNK
jgi:selenocysteine lyase/cysteine desulfurase